MTERLQTNGLLPSVCIDAVLAEVEPSEAISMVAEAGIGAFEFWSWWDKDLESLVQARDRWGVQIAACCTRFVSLVDPSRRAEYLQGLQDSLEVARRLDCRTLISQVGDELVGVPRKLQHASLVEGLQAAAPLLEKAGITLVIEPLNLLVDHPGYYLARSEEAFEIVDEVQSERVRVVFDIYHQQITEGQVTATIVKQIEKIGHFHAAGNPGRHELSVGELHYPHILEAIGATAYQGFVGLEYWPLKDPQSGLREVADWFGCFRA